ncbi:MAG: NAD-dependent epimerase/dehydratase family protein, partial [Pseudomonadota bacterium]
MTTLVTGGGGFVGSHLVAALLARGEKVRIIDLSDQVSHEAALVKGSVTDADAAARACEGVDTVFHLAGNAQLWARDARVFDDINHQGTRTMLAAARAAGFQSVRNANGDVTDLSSLIIEAAAPDDGRLVHVA